MSEKNNTSNNTGATIIPALATRKVALTNAIEPSEAHENNHLLGLLRRLLVEDVISRADKAMYKAKKSGKNRVEAAD